MPRCSGCHAHILWIKTAAGKNMPINPDGTPHWVNCPKAKDFKRAAPKKKLPAETPLFDEGEA
jgi:hypothetical protein